MSLTLYWGCTIDSKFPRIRDALRKVLDASGVDFEEFSGDLCCGLPLVLAGDPAEASRCAVRLVRELEGAGTVLTPCAGCYATFSKRYGKAYGSELPFEALHSTQLIDRLIASGRLKLEGKGETSVVFHDPCELGRKCGVYEEPRRVLRSIPNVRLVEAEFAKERSNCCGGGGLLPSSLPELAIEMASTRISKDFLPSKPDALVTSCPSCYLNFSRAIERYAYGIRLLDVAEIVAEHAR
ncbi:MAG: (Fe-S)-binding protein [Candidatus Brockarchaeota archaeon]|nr:(Fe-S)-binding protein [Candidatus Brockarchaeota archaeon]